MSLYEEAKKHMMNKFNISEKDYNEIYEIFSNRLNFLQDIDINLDKRIDLDEKLYNDDSIFQEIFIDILKIKENELLEYLDYVTVAFSCMHDSMLTHDYFSSFKDYVMRLSLYSLYYKTVKRRRKYTSSYSLEHVLVYKYEEIIESPRVPNYYKNILDLYKKIYKKYDVLENGFMSFFLYDSFEYFVANDSFKKDYDKVYYFLSLIYDDYEKFQDIVLLSGKTLNNYSNFTDIYNSISIPKKGII